MSEEFFRDNGDSLIKVNFYEVTGEFTVEELYQAFKERFLEEIKPTQQKEADG